MAYCALFYTTKHAVWLLYFVFSIKKESILYKCYWICYFLLGKSTRKSNNNLVTFFRLLLYTSFHPCPVFFVASSSTSIFSLVIPYRNPYLYVMLPKVLYKHHVIYFIGVKEEKKVVRLNILSFFFLSYDGSLAAKNFFVILFNIFNTSILHDGRRKDKHNKDKD